MPQTAELDDPAGDSTARAEALLAATNAFVACDDLAALGRAAVEAAVRMFGPDKTAVTLIDPAGDLRIVATHGYTNREQALGQGAITTRTPFVQRILDGQEAWTDQDHPAGVELAERLQAYGQVAGFTLPIAVGSEVVGFFGGTYGAARTFDGADHEAARSLAAQLALGYELLLARDDLAAQRDRLATEVAERTRELEATVDELRRASDAKTEFLANVSHELRTPLTSILGFADLLVAGAEGSLNHAQHQDALTIQTNGRHLLELIDDLIDVASIEAGEMALDRRAVAVGPILESAVETLRPLASGKGIWLEVAPAHADIQILADAERLREVVLNLLSNAIKFTPSRGIVRVASFVVQGENGSRTVRIDVTDSGIGIDPADHERIFERFVRTDVPAYPGTGLGLSIARALARLHGGDLTVDSTLGLGSTFSVVIPAAQAPA